MGMRISHISLIAVVLVVIAVAVAGCSGNSGAQPIVKDTQAAGTTTSGSSSSSGSTSSGSSSSGGSGSAASGANLFSGLNYNWVEYKMSTGSGGEAMTIYMKYNRVTGKCSMRFEGAAAANMPASMQEMDCSAQGGQATASDPNKVSSDAKVDCGLVPESVTVPAGTFSATKCTITSQGHTSTAWIVKDKFMVKMESSSDAGNMNMVLNQYG
jgi:hypothetical protein